MRLLAINHLISFITLYAALPEYLELNVTPFKHISRLSSYVRCTGKSPIISSANGVCSTVAAGLRLIFTQIWNVIAVVLEIVNFPTDRCCAALTRCFSPVTNAIRALCAPANQTQTMPVAVSLARVEEGGAWGRSGGNTVGGGGGRVLGGTTGTSSLTRSAPNPSKGGYAAVPQES